MRKSPQPGEVLRIAFPVPFLHLDRIAANPESVPEKARSSVMPDAPYEAPKSLLTGGSLGKCAAMMRVLTPLCSACIIRRDQGPGIRGRGSGGRSEAWIRDRKGSRPQRHGKSHRQDRLFSPDWSRASGSRWFRCFRSLDPLPRGRRFFCGGRRLRGPWLPRASIGATASGRRPAPVLQ